MSCGKAGTALPFWMNTGSVAAREATIAMTGKRTVSRETHPAVITAYYPEVPGHAPKRAAGRDIRTQG